MSYPSAGYYCCFVLPDFVYARQINFYKDSVYRLGFVVVVVVANSCSLAELQIVLKKKKSLLPHLLVCV